MCIVIILVSTGWLVLYTKTFYFRLLGLASCIWQIHLTKYSPLENLPILMIADSLLINLQLTTYVLHNIFIHTVLSKNMQQLGLTRHKTYIFQDWSIRILRLSISDSGVYKCQANSHPPQFITVNLHVDGKL